MAERNLEPLEGFKNRHIDGLPTEECHMLIVVDDSSGRATHLCEWKPRDSKDTADDGYLGTAYRLSNGKTGFIGFNVWESNNHEFVYYQKLDLAPAKPSVYAKVNIKPEGHLKG